MRAWLLLCLLIGTAAWAQESTRIAEGNVTVIAPVTHLRTIAPGDTLPIPIYARPIVSGLDSLEFIFRYDSTHFAYVGAHFGRTLLGDTSQVTTFSQLPVTYQTETGWDVTLSWWQNHPGYWSLRAYRPGNGLTKAGVLCYLVLTTRPALSPGDTTYILTWDGQLNGGGYLWGNGNREWTRQVIQPVLPGDVNGDQQVTAYDAALILRSTVGILRWHNQARMDMDGNGSASAYDAAQVLRHSIGLTP